MNKDDPMIPMKLLHTKTQTVFTLRSKHTMVKKKYNNIYLYTILLIFAFLFFTQAGAHAFQDTLQEGDEAYGILQYDRALELYNRAVESDPALENDQAFVLKRGMAALKTGDYTLAQTLLVHAKTLGSDFGDYIDYFTAIAAYYGGKPEYALTLASGLTSKYPRSMVRIEAQYLAGYITHVSGRAEESNTFLLPLTRARGLQAGTNLVQFMTGINFLNMGQVKEGEERLMRIIAGAPSDSSALGAADIIMKRRKQQKNPLSEKEIITFAGVYRRNRQTGTASSLITEYFKRFPDGRYTGEALYQRGLLNYSGRRYTQAIADFQKAFTLLDDPRKIRDCRFNIGRSKAQKGDWTGANAEYARYAREYPADRKAAEALWLIGLNFERRGKLPEAAKAYLTVAEKSRSASYRDRAKFRAGFCWYKNDYLTKASKYFNGIRKQSPASALGTQAAFWEAKALEKLGKQEEAQQIYEELAKYTTRYYYVIAARERTDSDFTFEDDQTGIFHADYPEPLRRAVQTGKMFGEPWGTRELKQYGRKAGSGRKALINLYNAYVETGIYDEAIRIADLMYHRYFNRRPNREIFTALYPVHYSGIVGEIPEARRLENELIYSIIRRESLFGYDAVSSAGAGGLMQLMPSTAASLARTLEIAAFSFEDVFRPKMNMRLGIRNIRDILQRFRGNIPAAAAAYNAGDTAVRRWMKRYGSGDTDEFIENIEYSETNTFVKEVLKNYYFYRQLYARGS